MASFTDHDGRNWEVRLSLETLMRLERTAGIGVLAIWADPVRIRDEFFGRLSVIIPLLEICTEAQAKSRDINRSRCAKYSRIKGTSTAPRRRWEQNSRIFSSAWPRRRRRPPPVDLARYSGTAGAR